jgi:hypothetical protein
MEGAHDSCGDAASFVFFWTALSPLGVRRTTYLGAETGSRCRIMSRAFEPQGPRIMEWQRSDGAIQSTYVVIVVLLVNKAITVRVRNLG